MQSVYVTYSGYNCEAVLQVMETLVRSGYALMCECMLPYGDDPEEQAHRHIRDADVVVAVITADAADCPYMARDLAWAREAGKKLLMVSVGDVSLPEACHLSESPTNEEMARFLQML